MFLILAEKKQGVKNGRPEKVQIEKKIKGAPVFAEAPFWLKLSTLLRGHEVELVGA